MTELNFCETLLTNLPKAERSNPLIHDPVAPELRAKQNARTFRRRSAGGQQIETADLLKRSGGGAHILEPRFRNEAALVDVQVVAKLAQCAVYPCVVACPGDAEPGIPARIDLSETVNQRDRPRPRSVVHGGVEAELGEIESSRLQRQRNVDRVMALVNGSAEVDARCDVGAKPCDAAPGASPIASKVELRAGPGRDAVPLAPGP